MQPYKCSRPCSSLTFPYCPTLPTSQPLLSRTCGHVLSPACLCHLSPRLLLQGRWHGQECTTIQSAAVRGVSPAAAPVLLELWLLHAAAEPCRTTEAPAQEHRDISGWTMQIVQSLPSTQPHECSTLMAQLIQNRCSSAQLMSASVCEGMKMRRGDRLLPLDRAFQTPVCLSAALSNGPLDCSAAPPEPVSAVVVCDLASSALSKGSTVCNLTELRISCGPVNLQWRVMYQLAATASGCSALSPRMPGTKQSFRDPDPKLHRC